MRGAFDLERALTHHVRAVLGVDVDEETLRPLGRLEERPDRRPKAFVVSGDHQHRHGFAFVERRANDQMPDETFEFRASGADAGALEVVAKREGNAVAARTVDRALLDRDDTSAATLVVTHDQSSPAWARRKDEGDLVPEVLRVWLTVDGEEQRLARVRQEGTEEASKRRLLSRELV